MATTIRVTIEDDAYIKAQNTIEAISQMLLDPKWGLGAPTLDLFIERADRAMGAGPVLHPSEYRAGADKLHEVLACAHALRNARDVIARLVP
jgi:hypothetical protein